MPSSPIHEIRRGLILARIRQKRTRQGVRHTVTVVRLYRNGDVWKESTRFGTKDLPLVNHLLQLVHAWILLHSPRGES